MTKEKTVVSAALKSRVERMRRKARNYLAKTEIIQFRLDEESYLRLFAIAEQLRKPVGTLVREWVTKQIALAESNPYRNKNEPLKPAERVTIEQIITLQKQIDQLKQQFS